MAYQDPTTGARAELGPAITLGFDDLAVIVKGSEDDAIAMKPFVKCFRKDNILRSALGFPDLREQEAEEEIEEGSMVCLSKVCCERSMKRPQWSDWGPSVYDRDPEDVRARYV